MATETTAYLTRDLNAAPMLPDGLEDLVFVPAWDRPVPEGAPRFTIGAVLRTILLFVQQGYGTPAPLMLEAADPAYKDRPDEAPEGYTWGGYDFLFDIGEPVPLARLRARAVELGAMARAQGWTQFAVPTAARRPDGLQCAMLSNHLLKFALRGELARANRGTGYGFSVRLLGGPVAAAPSATVETGGLTT